MPKFKWAIDGREGEEFEAHDLEHAKEKAMSWSGLGVWEVEIPQVKVDFGGFVDWYFDEDTCECQHFVEGGTIYDLLDTVGLIPMHLILNPEIVEEEDIYDETLENPSSYDKKFFVRAGKEWIPMKRRTEIDESRS